MGYGLKVLLPHKLEDHSLSRRLVLKFVYEVMHRWGYGTLHIMIQGCDWDE